MGRSLLFAACLTALASAAPSRAERVDLTPYLAPRPVAGDYLVYEKIVGGSSYQDRIEVVSVDDVSDGWRVEWERSSVTYAEIVRPGVKIRRATPDDGPPPGCRLAVDYDLRACDLRMPIGGSHPFRRAYLDSDGFLSFYWARRLGRYRLEGFEPIETPYASHESAVRLTSVVREWHARVRLGPGFEIESKGPLRLDSVETRQSWFVEGVGLVGLRVTPGEPAESETSAPTLEMWLKRGRVQGLFYPSPAPVPES